MSQQTDWSVKMERKREQEYVRGLVGKLADLVNGNSTKKWLSCSIRASSGDLKTMEGFLHRESPLRICTLLLPEGLRQF